MRGKKHLLIPSIFSLGLLQPITVAHQDLGAVLSASSVSSGSTKTSEDLFHLLADDPAPSSSLLSQKRLTIHQALSVLTDDTAHTIIHQVMSKHIPPHYGRQKKFIVLHGSGCKLGVDPDKSLLYTGQKTNHFAYMVSRKGEIFQFFDDGKGTGGAGPVAMVDGMNTLEAIGIEMSLYADSIPNSLQVEGARRLVDHLKQLHGIELVVSHYETNLDEKRTFISTPMIHAHTDGQTRPFEIQQALGMSDPESYSRYGDLSHEAKIRTIKKTISDIQGQHMKNTAKKAASIYFRQMKLKALMQPSSSD